MFTFAPPWDSCGIWFYIGTQQTIEAAGRKLPPRAQSKKRTQLGAELASKIYELIY